MYPHAHHGFDRQGRPIYIDRSGLADLDRLLHEVSIDDVVHFHILMARNGLAAGAVTVVGAPFMFAKMYRVCVTPPQMEFQARVLMREGSRRVGHTVDTICNGACRFLVLLSSLFVECPPHLRRQSLT